MPATRTGNIGRGVSQSTPFTIRTLGASVDGDVSSSLASCAAAINTLIGTVATLQDAIATLQSRPLTANELAQVQAALSATGSNPLNVTGLVGIPTAQP